MSNFSSPPNVAPAQSYAPQPTKKNWIAAVLLSLFLGTFGIDRFYLGHVGLGIAKLLLSWATLGVWQLIDFFLIASRKVGSSEFSWDDDHGFQGSVRSFPAALVLSFFLGGIGLDRFYVGHIGLGFAKFFLNWATLGIWWIVDFILFCMKKVDSSGFRWN